MTTTQACSQYQFTNNMLKKEDYVYFKSDTEFVYYGAPIPVLDNSSLSGIGIPLYARQNSPGGGPTFDYNAGLFTIPVYE